MSTTELTDLHPFRSTEARDLYLARYDAQARVWPVPSDTRTVSTAQGDTLVRVSGPLGGPPLVMLGGVWAHSLSWSPAFVAALSEHCRTYTVDNIVDFGRSVSSRRVRATKDFMTWLDDLFDSLDLANGLNLLGLSRGAWLAAEYTLHAPHRLAKCVWLSPGATVLLSSLGGLKGGPLSSSATRKPSRRTVGALMSWLMPDLEQADPHGFREYVDDVAMGLQCFNTKEVGRLMGPRKFSNTELQAVRVPVLYAAGADEKMYSAKAAASRLARVAPQIETTVFDDCGHDMLSVQPDIVGERVLRFLDV